MGSIRYKNILKTFQWLINLALYLQIGIAVVILISLIFIFSGEGEMVSWVDATIGEQSTSKNLVSKNTSINNVQLVLNQGSIKFSSKGVGYYLLKILDSVTVVTLGIFVTFLLRKIVRSIKEQDLFTLENILRIRKIAFILIFLTPYSLIRSIIYRSYIVENVSIEGLEYAKLFGFNLFKPDLTNKIWLGLDFNLQSLLTGIVLLTIAEVFRLGMKIRLDSESII